MLTLKKKVICGLLYDIGRQIHDIDTEIQSSIYLDMVTCILKLKNEIYKLDSIMIYDYLPI